MNATLFCHGGFAEIARGSRSLTTHLGLRQISVDPVRIAISQLGVRCDYHEIRPTSELDAAWVTDGEFNLTN